MILTGQADGMTASLRARYPHMPPLPPVKLQLLPWQMAALYALTWGLLHERRELRVLEIGGGAGGSAYMMARAASAARITSLNINPREADAARAFLRRAGCANVTVEVCASWDYLASSIGSYDLIFVDGDHNQIARDLAWFDRLTIGGLMVCHDYSPAGSAHPSPMVYAALNDMEHRLRRSLDVRLMDETQTGMAGFYRREGETWA